MHCRQHHNREIDLFLRRPQTFGASTSVVHKWRDSDSLKPNFGWKERFRYLFNSTAFTDLDHPALPHVYKIFHISKLNQAFMLADYIEGPSLETLRLQQLNHRFSPLQVMTFIVPVIEAIAYLHNQDRPIIHGNIKPSNIIMRKKDGIAMLVGFNLIKVKNRNEDKTTNFGWYHAPGFIAPEQCDGEIDHRTDIYALGAVLYTLLTGNIPAGVLYRIRHLTEKKPDPLFPINNIVPNIPTEIAYTIYRAMSIDKNNRYDTIEQFWEALWGVSIITLNRPIHTKESN